MQFVEVYFYERLSLLIGFYLIHISKIFYAQNKHAFTTWNKIKKMRLTL